MDTGYDVIIMVKDFLDDIFNAFIACFENKGYIRIAEVPISSGIDETVTLIGSGISVLKPYLLEKSIPTPGVMIAQKAIRTQKLCDIYNKDCVSEYNSFFDAFCVLTNYENLEKLFKEVESFFCNNLQLRSEDILFKVSSQDKDLLNACCATNCLIIKDSEGENYYRHKYGLDDKGIYGRNVNFALKNPVLGTYQDVGNIIVIESDKEVYGVEFATGVQPIALRLLGASNTLEVSYIADCFDVLSPALVKYADSLIVVALLEYENINKCKKRYPKYLYKKYYRAMKYWQKELHISDETLQHHIEAFISLEMKK